ncbi:MAG: hypothetical protein ACRDV2_04425 [Actinomycetes bacterium]
MDADGAVCFLGRGSICINSGGEKVAPVPQLHPASDYMSQEDLDTHLAPLIARYKLPRLTRVVPRIERSPPAKPDYRRPTETLARADQDG